MTSFACRIPAEAIKGVELEKGKNLLGPEALPPRQVVLHSEVSELPVMMRQHRVAARGSELFY